MIAILLRNRKLALWAALVVLVIAGGGWLRWDAVRDFSAAQDAAAAKARFKVKDDAEERRNEVENLNRDALRDSLLSRLPRPQ